MVNADMAHNKRKSNKSIFSSRLFRHRQCRADNDVTSTSHCMFTTRKDEMGASHSTSRRRRRAPHFSMVSNHGGVSRAGSTNGAVATVCTNTCNENDAASLSRSCSRTEEHFMHNCEVTQQLIDKSGDLDAVDVDGASFLFIAVLYDCIACVVKLLDAGANVDQPNVGGTTPLMLACELGQLPIVDVLMEKAADVNVRANRGTAAIHSAVCCGHDNAAEIVQRLTNARAEVNVKSSYGTPLACAVVRVPGNITQRIVLDLLRCNADIDEPAGLPDVLEGRPATPFELAITVGNFEVAELLHYAGCSVRCVYTWMSSGRFPRLLQADQRWKRTVISWATSPMSLKDLTRVAIRRAAILDLNNSVYVPVSLHRYLRMQSYEDESV